MRENIRRYFIDFTLPDASGNEINLAEMIEGKVAVLELWASWCRLCRVNARALKPLYGCPDAAGRTILIDKNGIIVRIDPTKEEIEQYLKENLKNNTI